MVFTMETNSSTETEQRWRKNIHERPERHTNLFLSQTLIPLCVFQGKNPEPGTLRFESGLLISQRHNTSGYFWAAGKSPSLSTSTMSSSGAPGNLKATTHSIIIRALGHSIIGITVIILILNTFTCQSGRSTTRILLASDLKMYCCLKASFRTTGQQPAAFCSILKACIIWIKCLPLINECYIMLLHLRDTMMYLHACRSPNRSTMSSSFWPRSKKTTGIKSISSRTGRCCGFQQPNLLQSHTLKRPATEKLRNFGHLHGWNSLCKIERKTYSKKHHKHLQALLVELPKGLLFAPNRIHQTQIQLIQWALSSCIILYIDRIDRWIIATCPWGLGETGEA